MMSMAKPDDEDRLIAPFHQSGGKLYGREAESEVLEGTIEKARAENAPMQTVFVSGESGTGKSELVSRAFGGGARQTSHSNNLLFGSGKFEEQTDPKPFAAVIAAVSNLCEEAVARSENCRNALSELLDDDSVSTLVSVMPRLKAILRPEPSSPIHPEAEGAANGAKQHLEKLKHSLRLLLQAIASPEFPVVLFLDDLQWLDASSHAILKYITGDNKLHNFVFVGSYRSNAVTDDSDLIQWIQTLEKTKESELIKVQTKDLDLKNAALLLSDLLRTELEYVEDLACLLHERTNGNALHLLQLIDFLEQENLLQYSFVTLKWTWSIPRIQAQTNLSDNVVDIVMHKMLKQPPAVQDTLKVCGFLGFQCPLDVLRDVVDAIPNDLGPEGIDGCLNVLISEGILEHPKGGHHIKFVHDRIHQAAVALAGSHTDQMQLHYQIGKALWGKLGFPQKLLEADQSGDDDRRLFVCADHMNLALDIVSDDDMLPVHLAMLNVQASKRSASYSSFFPALSYIKTAICLMDSERSWDEHHDLMLDTYTTLAQLNFSAGNMEDSVQAARVAQEKAKSIVESEQAAITLLECLGSLAKYDEQISVALDILGNLGEKISIKPRAVYAKYVLRRARLQLAKTPFEEIMKFPSATNLPVGVAIHVMSKIINTLEMTDNFNLSALVLSKTVQLTFEHGLTPYSSIVFAYAAAASTSYWNDVELGHNLAKLAVKLLEKEENNSVAARVGMTSNMVLHWRTPLSLTVDSWIVTHKQAMKAGEIQVAMMNAVGYGQTYYYAGLPLQPLVKDQEKFCALMHDYGQMFPLFTNVPLFQCVLNLTGSEGHARDIADLSEGRAADYRKQLGWDGSTGQQTEWSYTMQIAFFVERFDLATAMYQKLEPLPVGNAKSLPYYQSRVFFFCLIAIHNAKTRTAAAGRSSKFRAAAQRHFKTLKSWVVNQKAINVAHKLMIAEAEMMTLKSNVNERKVTEEFEKAIVASIKSGFFQDAAIAAHLASRACGKDPSRRDDYMQTACDFYGRWEAQGVVDYLVFNSESSLQMPKLGRYGSYRSRQRYDRNLIREHRSSILERKDSPGMS